MMSTRGKIKTTWGTTCRGEPGVEGDHYYDDNDEASDDEELTIYELHFLNEHAVVVPLNSILVVNKSSTEDSSSSDNDVPINSVLKKRSVINSLVPLSSKSPKRNDGGLLDRDDISTVVANIGWSTEEASQFIKEKNIRIMIYISLKQNEDFLQDIVTPQIHQQQQAIHNSILQLM